MPQTAAANPRRRWSRFSFRTLLVVLALLSAALGWLALKVRQAERQRKAVTAIRKAGGYVLYDYECWNGIPILDGKPPPPAWLREVLGEDFFSDVVQARFGYVSNIGGTGLKDIKEE